MRTHWSLHVLADVRICRVIQWPIWFRGKLRDHWQRQIQPRQRLAVLTYTYVAARLQQDFDRGVVEKEGSVG